ncbi:TPA_asm: LPXTG cell wall anchor domain-containing protein [Listeria monocytogenes]|nr:LPXTG cell wall anchor domain-containing protein [Listeria monocytogenes]HAC0982462.1 LPXTG cell wall anchor domain-containing protein [Listeria monocytogenes]
MKKIFMALTFLTLLGIGFMFSPTSGSAAQSLLITPTPINQVFPDSALAEAIRVKTNKASTSDLITQANLDTVGELTVTNVASLEGVQYIRVLSTLQATNGTITDISSISGLTNLRYVNLSSNNITNITPVAGLTNLDTLWLNSNHVSDLSPVSNLSVINSLGLNNNNISNLSPLTGLNDLFYLFLSTNNLTDISLLSGLTNLGEIFLDNNHIRDASALKNHNNLEYVVLNNQTITNPSIPFDTHMTIKNNIIGPDGGLVNVGGGLVYNEPDIIWDYASYIPSTNYQFIQTYPMSTGVFTFSGTVTQPVSETYKVSFSLEGQITKSLYIASGNSVPAQTEPSKAGYVFKGWYTAATGGTKWDFTTDKVPTNAITLYAQFTQPQTNYNATFDVDGVTTTSGVAGGNLLPAQPTPTKTGYTFDGWYDAATGGNKWDFQTDVMPENDITLYARFSVNNYVLTLNNNGATTAQNVDYHTKATAPTDPSKLGYTFNGWYDAVTGGNKWNFQTDLMPDKNITLYAQFSVNSYVLTFDNDGDLTTQNVDFNANAVKPTEPIKKGHAFKGWFTDQTGGTIWNFLTDKMPANAQTLHALFDITSYTLTFDNDGKTTTQNLVYDTKALAPADPTKAGYTFKGWYDAKTGRNKWDFTADKMPANNVTLYAQFTKNDSVKEPTTPNNGNGNGGINGAGSGNGTKSNTTNTEATSMVTGSNTNTVYPASNGKYTSSALPSTGDTTTDGLLAGMALLGLGGLFLLRRK